MANMIHMNGPIAIEPPSGTYFSSLASSIISQQISVKAAAKITERFARITNFDPVRTLALSSNNQSEIGLSGQKVRYLQSLAQHFIDDEAVFSHLETLKDSEVIAELTSVTGIGVWTAQMFLMFTLNRPDVFAPADRGLQLAIEKHYAETTALDTLAMRWAPFRTTACLHLWKSLDNQPKIET